MLIRWTSGDCGERFDDIEIANRNQNHGKSGLVESPMCCQFQGLQSSPTAHDVATHGAQGSTENSITGNMQYVSVVSQDNFPSPSAHQSLSEEYSMIYRRPLECQKNQTRFRMSRMLPVGELELVVDRILTNHNSNSNGKSTVHLNNPYWDLSVTTGQLVPQATGNRPMIRQGHAV